MLESRRWLGCGNLNALRGRQPAEFTVQGRKQLVLSKLRRIAMAVSRQLFRVVSHGRQDTLTGKQWPSEIRRFYVSVSLTATRSIHPEFGCLYPTVRSSRVAHLAA